MDICKQIANTRKKQLDEEQQYRDDLAKAFTKLMKAFRAKLPQLQEAYRIFCALKENNYLMLKEDMYYKREKHYELGYFLSDGWFHWPGFTVSKPGRYYTFGSGACQFSCGIDINTGKVLVAEREYGKLTTPVSDTAIRNSIKGDYSFHTKDYLAQGDGKYFSLKGTEIMDKLKYCYNEVDRFCKAINDYANQIVGK